MHIFYEYIWKRFYCLVYLSGCIGHVMWLYLVELSLLRDCVMFCSRVRVRITVRRFSVWLCTRIFVGPCLLLSIVVVTLPNKTTVLASQKKISKPVAIWCDWIFFLQKSNPQNITSNRKSNVNISKTNLAIQIESDLNCNRYLLFFHEIIRDPINLIFNSRCIYLRVSSRRITIQF